MLNIVRLDARTKEFMARALAGAVETGCSARVCTGEDANGKWVKWDTGAGWTPPYYSEDY